ncbi:MAG: GNAT family N-acetyltransferase [Armatimonadetes bacterium]|nr:GNAT family N-acetyltransferase [Armatimonadota bacterium]
MSRLATSTDLEGILRLAARKIHATWPSQSPQETTLAFWHGLRESAAWPSEYDLFVTDEAQGITGFLVLKKQLTRTITGDRESVIHDFFAQQISEHTSLVECAAEAARGYESQYLTTELSPGDRPDRELLESLGFRLESHRISVVTADCRAPEGSPYSVRPVAAGDDFLIAVLNATMLSHTLCAGREYNLSELTFRSMGAMVAQANRHNPDSAALVLTLGQELVGHLLLELSDRIGYIYDLALAREHWGGTAVRHLMRAGSRLLFQRGIPLMVGDVSASNRRALTVARRALGFAVDCQRYGLKL